MPKMTTIVRTPIRPFQGGMATSFSLNGTQENGCALLS